MLQIHENKDLSEYSSAVTGIDDPRVVESIGSDGEKTGYAVYSYTDNMVYIYRCEYGTDIYLCDGILRAVMFKAYLRGIKKAQCEACSQGQNLFEKLKYPCNSQMQIESIDSFFNECKKCKEMN
ncbi:MAG: hypothetical protein Q4F95_14290 [Oscillospiraceae bacterium]|nr:hypothetical protein [Oscillospiraceae bacterium]